MTTKNNIIQEKLQVYLKANKKEKGVILDSVCNVMGIQRKAAIRAFRRTQLQTQGKKEGRGRPRIYTQDVIAALRDVFDLANESCAENLHPMVTVYVAELEKENEWAHTSLVKEKLSAMSLGSMKEYIATFTRIKYSVRGKGTTQKSSLHSLIPMRMDGWKQAIVGTCQLDTVAHCGDTTRGDFVFTTNMIEVTTLWGERRAQWNKGQQGTLASVDASITSFPIPVREIHPDSGGEFINWNMLMYCKENNVSLTRSRPYHKNDNCFVEERNGHIVRKYLGYARFDCVELVVAVNHLYDVLTPYLNYFIASTRVISKEKVGARWKITRDTALTPYQRMLLRTDVIEDDKTRLRAIYASLSMVYLLTEIDIRKKKVFTLLQQHKDLKSKEM